MRKLWKRTLGTLTAAALGCGIPEDTVSGTIFELKGSSDPKMYNKFCDKNLGAYQYTFVTGIAAVK